MFLFKHALVWMDSLPTFDVRPNSHNLTSSNFNELCDAKVPEKFNTSVQADNDSGCICGASVLSADHGKTGLAGNVRQCLRPTLMMQAIDHGRVPWDAKAVDFLLKFGVKGQAGRYHQASTHSY